MSLGGVICPAGSYSQTTIYGDGFSRFFGEGSVRVLATSVSAGELLMTLIPDCLDIRLYTIVHYLSRGLLEGAGTRSQKLTAQKDGPSTRFQVHLARAGREDRKIVRGGNLAKACSEGYTSERVGRVEFFDEVSW